MGRRIYPSEKGNFIDGLGPVKLGLSFLLLASVLPHVELTKTIYQREGVSFLSTTFASIAMGTTILGCIMLKNFK